MEISADIFEQFTFLDEHLVYVDAPLEGFLRAKQDGQLFAFGCDTIVADLLWHWSLIPVASTERPVADVLRDAGTNPPVRWLSVIEDRRSGASSISSAWLTGICTPLNRSAITIARSGMRPVAEHVFGDLSVEFLFDEEQLDYYDRPLSGWLQRRCDDVCFAFQCQPLVWERLWHWTLVQSVDKAIDPLAVIANAAKAPTGEWSSIVEDRTSTPSSICRMVVLSADAAGSP